jgi:hypothetical protein
MIAASQVKHEERTMTMTREIHLPPPFVPPKKLMSNLLAIAVTGALVTVIGIILVPERTWPNFLLAAQYLLGLGLAGAVFIALQYVSNAGWAVALRRVPEAMLKVLPLAAALMLLTLFGLQTLYPWSRADALLHDPLLRSKTWWLNVPAFSVRTVVYLALWLAVTYALTRNSERQDTGGSLAYTRRNTKRSAVFLVVLGLTFTLASMDWIMSIEPDWYSTIFGIYNFSGMFLNGLAAMTMLVIILRRMGPLHGVVTEFHLHSLGKLIFAFATFWMYIWFSQYLLIWYSNMPEEVTYLVHREKGSWLIFTIVNVLFNWAIPFVVLLPRWTKVNEGLLFKVCIIVMIGRWIDLFWMILPPFMPEAPYVNVWELAPFAGMIALFFYSTLRALSGVTIVPVGDPMLEESLSRH